MTHIDIPTSYEDLINNAKPSFTKEADLNSIFEDAIENETFDDYKWAIKECHLILMQMLKDRLT